MLQKAYFSCTFGILVVVVVCGLDDPRATKRRRSPCRNVITNACDILANLVVVAAEHCAPLFGTRMMMTTTVLMTLSNNNKKHGPSVWFDLR